jgi:hypothetical protein
MLLLLPNTSGLRCVVVLWMRDLCVGANAKVLLHAPSADIVEATCNIIVVCFIFQINTLLVCWKWRVPTECPSSTFSNSHTSLSRFSPKITSDVHRYLTKCTGWHYVIQCRSTRGSFVLLLLLSHLTSPNAISVSTTDEIWRRNFNLAPFAYLEEHREGMNDREWKEKRKERTAHLSQILTLLTAHSSLCVLLDTITSTVV